MMKSVKSLKDIKDKKVLLRADFDVPVGEKKDIQESFRVKKQKETLDWLLQQGAKVAIIAHISSVPSFFDLLPQLEELLGRKLFFIKEIKDANKSLDTQADTGLLDNIRLFDGEEKNDSEFALELSQGFDFYVNNAFAVCHRNHASVSAISNYLPSYAGLLIEEEVEKMQSIIDAPENGKIIIMGGAKTSTKIPVIKNLLNSSEKILIGGIIANDILKTKGFDIKATNVDSNAEELLKGINLDDPKLVLPIDLEYSDHKIWDIGPKSVEKFAPIIRSAKMIVWNGPVGFFEQTGFEKGTYGVARLIAGSSGVKIIGGGDTISAVNKINLIDKFDFVSTGGGAMLSFLSGEKLPALEALGYYEKN